MVEQSTPAILAQAVGTAVKVDLRLMLDRTFIAAKNSGVGFNVASISAGVQCAEPRPVRSELHESVIRCRL